MRAADLAREFLAEVIDPALRHLGLYEPRMNSDTARALLLGTAMVESDLTHTRQIGGGPALGFFQMEPATHSDCWDNWLIHRLELANACRVAAGSRRGSRPAAEELAANPIYAAVMCRIKYWRARAPLPALGPEGLCRYHERHYNTRLGAVGRTPELEGLPAFVRAVFLVEAHPQEYMPAH